MTTLQSKSPRIAEEWSSIVVWKFGGTSVGNHDRLRTVAERLVAAQQQGCRVVAVLSAMGTSTDGLFELAAASSALRKCGAAIGVIVRDGDEMRFTTPGTADADVAATLSAVGADVKVLDELGSVSVVSAGIARKPAITARALTTLEAADVEPQLVTTTPGRVTAHISTELLDDAVRLLHDVFIPGPTFLSPTFLESTTRTALMSICQFPGMQPDLFHSLAGRASPYFGLGEA